MLLLILIFEKRCTRRTYYSVKRLYSLPHVYLFLILTIDPSLFALSHTPPKRWAHTVSLLLMFLCLTHHDPNDRVVQTSAHLGCPSHVDASFKEVVEVPSELAGGPGELLRGAPGGMDQLIG